jgi:acyl-CoA synthetase (AMP-forming)/AMP-acid ligase II
MTESGRFFRSSFPDHDAVGFRSAVWKYSVPGADEPVETLYPTLTAMLAAKDELPDDIGITFCPDGKSAPEEHRSYRSIARDARIMAAALSERGIRRGDCVLMVFPTGFDFIVTFFALLLLGAIPVPSYPPGMTERPKLAIERMGHVARHSGVVSCVTIGALVPLLGELARFAETLREIVAVDRIRLDRDPAEVDFPAIVPRQTAFIQYTSGSTGNPKGVELTHGAVASNIHVIGQGVRVNRSDRVASWLPLYHDMGLVGGLLMPFYFHVPLVLMSPTAFLMRPSRWLWAMARHRVTVTVAPNFGYALCVKRVTESEIEGLDLSSLRVTLNGAEPINYRTIVDFERKYVPYGFNPRAMFPVYGQAEAVVALTFPPPGTPVRVEVISREALANGHVVHAKDVGSMAVVGVGSALPGHRVHIVDAEGNAVPDATVGHIVVRGPSVMKNYYRAPEETARVLRDGWLWTGDLGFFIEGMLFIAGRAKDLIIVRGHNYYPEDLERVAERVPGVRPGGVVGFAVYDEENAVDLAVLIVETKVTDADEQAALVQKIQTSIADHCGLRVDEVVLVPPKTIPKTSSGKRQRALTRQRYLDRQLFPEDRPTRLQMVMVFVRSGRGILKLLTRRITAKRREPA